MLNVLRADFHRMLKSKVFLFEVIAMVAVSVYCVLGTKYGDIWSNAHPEDIIILGSTLLGVFSAVFSAFFIGTQHSDGAFRNRFSVGHTRTAVYFSNLLVCIAQAVIINTIYIVLAAVGGRIFLGKFILSFGNIAFSLLAAYIIVISMAALACLVSMMITNKALGAVLILVLFILIYGSSTMISSRLEQPEYLSAYSYTIDGETYEADERKNPSYLSGTKRRVFEELYDTVPSGQLTQIHIAVVESAAAGEPLKDEIIKKMIKFAGISTLFTVAFSALGVTLFKRKDLK